MSQETSRRALGFATMIVTGFALNLVPMSPRFTHIIFSEQHLFIPTVWYFVLSIAPPMVGAYIARRRFLPIAVSFFLVIWAVGQYLLFQIAIVAGPASILNIALANVPSLFMMIVAAVLGTLIGEWLYGRQIEIVANAN